MGATGDAELEAELAKILDDLPRLLRHFRPRVDASLLEDVQQEVRIAFLEGIPAGYDRRRSLRAYVAGIARNKFVDMLKNLAPVLDLLSSDVAAQAKDAGLTPSRLVARDQLRAQLSDCIQQLPPHYREAVIMQYMRGLALAEIAERLATSIGTVKGLVGRARKMIGDCLGSSGAMRFVQDGVVRSSGPDDDA